MIGKLFLPALLCLLLACTPVGAQLDEMPWVAVARDKKGFILEPSGRRFTPWGFNYDHDEKGRLIEDYWEDEWPTVAAHFAQMKKLGANVVRVHLQVGRFMDGAKKPNGKALARLGKLLLLAERLRLYLDLTKLSCFPERTYPPGTTSWTRMADGPCKRVSGRRWRAAAPPAPPSSAMT